MHQPTTETKNLSTARQEFSQLVNRVYRGEARVLVEKSGIPVAAIVSAEDLARLKQLDEERETRFRALAASQAAFSDVSDDELARRVEEAIAAVRAAARVKSGRQIDEPVAKSA